MPALTIKNIPDDLYRELKHIAEQHQRSINSEVIMCLQNTLLPKRTSPEDRLQNIRALRSRVRNSAVSLKDIDQAINEGRP
ncbi:MAG: Arc family DNA-binding protein [Gammaproteobacteria bacterium]|nr:Arc family DNA-binding protein [Gammaproteobacteria bacterium]